MKKRKKRKQRTVKSHKAYYAVAIGRDGPNVYSTWPECKVQVNGFQGAQYKGFDSHVAALKYIDETLGVETALREKYSEPVEDDELDRQFDELDAFLARHE